ncbi:ABA4-like family protein [Bacterioplanoides sp.]|uniref:ABA4-like family protein n=1 Tax=Bacterioplanoides sp. TaxID=2066072 RepID=UPI003B5B67D7
MPVYSRIFAVANRITLVAWIALLVSLFLDDYREQIHQILFAVIIFGLSALYSYLMFLGKRHDGEGEKPKGHFKSLKGVMSLFKAPRAALAGWIHYLAFDLLTGILISQHALQHGISVWILIPILAFTLMLAPAGLMFYFLVFFIAQGEWLLQF